MAYRHLVLLAHLQFPGTVWAHGRLLVPAPRECKATGCGGSGIEDMDSPVNFNGDDAPEGNRLPVDDPTRHPEKQSFVCRVSAQDAVQAPLVQLTAGGTLAMQWKFAATHPGDGGLYLSYDYSATADNRQQMRFFKLANFPQMRRDSGSTVTVNIPDWLPPGRAVLRWDWYALHNDPHVEFYANCIDVDVISSSTLPKAAIVTYPIVVAPKEGAGAAAYSCSADALGNCAKGPFLPNQYPGNNNLGNGNYWNTYEPQTAPGYFLAGPPCVSGVSGNCTHALLSRRRPEDLAEFRHVCSAAERSPTPNLRSLQLLCVQAVKRPRVRCPTNSKLPATRRCRRRPAPAVASHCAPLSAPRVHRRRPTPPSRRPHRQLPSSTLHLRHWAAVPKQWMPRQVVAVPPCWEGPLADHWRRFVWSPFLPTSTCVGGELVVREAMDL